MTAPFDDSVVFLDESTHLVLEEMLRLSGLSREELVALVECGAVEPEGMTVEAWTFNARSALLARRAAGLRLEFGLDTQGTSLVLGLLERIDELEQRLRELRAQLPR